MRFATLVIGSVARFGHEPEEVATSYDHPFFITQLLQTVGTDEVSDISQWHARDA